MNANTHQNTLQNAAQSRKYIASIVGQAIHVKKDVPDQLLVKALHASLRHTRQYGDVSIFDVILPLIKGNSAKAMSVRFWITDATGHVWKEDDKGRIVALGGKRTHVVDGIDLDDPLTYQKDQVKEVQAQAKAKRDSVKAEEQVAQRNEIALCARNEMQAGLDAKEMELQDMARKLTLKQLVIEELQAEIAALRTQLANSANIDTPHANVKGIEQKAA